MPSSPCFCGPRLSRPFPTRRSSDLLRGLLSRRRLRAGACHRAPACDIHHGARGHLQAPFGTTRTAVAAGPETARLLATLRDAGGVMRSEEHTSELQSRQYLVCRLLLASAVPACPALSLHAALPISFVACSPGGVCAPARVTAHRRVTSTTARGDISRPRSARRVPPLQQGPRPHVCLPLCGMQEAS